MKLRPTKCFLWLWAAWFALGLAASLWPPAGRFWWAFAAAVFLVALVDWLLLFSGKKPALRREVPARFALDVPGEVVLRLKNRRRRGIRVRLSDGIPTVGETDNFPWCERVAGNSYAELRYPLTLKERGEVSFTLCHVLERSPLALWERRHRLGESATMKVYPNYQPILRFALMAVAQRQEQMGIVRKNRAGMSRDFHQLRDYQQGDNLARIDWKASSKRCSLISRDYQEQRDQTVIFLVDCGRRMRAMDGELSQFDHTLNALLFLSYVALRQGDKVGILSFGGADRWLPPVKGAQSMSTVLNHLYDYETAPFPSDFAEASERLLRHQQKRAMVVVVTNLRGEDGDDLVLPLRRLREKHLVVLASLREQSLENHEKAEIDGVDRALAYLSVKDYQREREEVLQKLAGHGVLTVDETARDFPVALANRYLDLRAAL